MAPYRIILADDHAMLREGIAKLINAAKGLQIVGEASDGLMLLKLMHHTTPDMVILDVSMPGLRGIEAAQEIRRTYPGVAILFLSMHKKKEYLHLALATGAKGYILKEDSGSELIQAIAEIRRGKTYLSPLFMKDVPADFIPIEGGAPPSPQEPLTAREKQVLQLIAEGKTSKEIGALLFISIHTVHSHRKNIKNKLDLRKNADLVRYAMEKGYADE
jgi:DNA-binding NarL/FixJ family response regulator